MKFRTVCSSLLLAAVTLAGCSSDLGDSGASADVSDTAVDESADAASDPVAPLECEQDSLSGDDDSFVFVSAYSVVDGELDDLCFGEANDLLLQAWNDLVSITPPGQLGDVGVFAGFEPDGGDADGTLAYVSALDSDGQQFQMSLNTVESSADPDELLLTLAHEFSHVFTQTAPQLDRTDEAIESCATYFNGEGCFFDDSLIMAWIDRFWDPEMLAEVDPLAASDEEMEHRCSIEEGFLGSYAASSPEEDFAEAFSAMVFRLSPATDGQAARFDWLAEQPGLVEFRDRADAAGMTPLANTFDICGG